jgi:hypothetical protein
MEPGFDGGSVREWRGDCAWSFSDLSKDGSFEGFAVQVTFEFKQVPVTAKSASL